MLCKAHELVSHSFGCNELITVWGENLEDVDQIKRVAAETVHRFFASQGGAEGFRRELLQLNHPHFHYELVFRLFCELLRQKDPAFVTKTGDLIGSLHKLGLSSAHEIVKGFSKILARLPELRIDYEDAGEVYERLRSRVMKGKVFGESGNEDEADE